MAIPNAAQQPNLSTSLPQSGLDVNNRTALSQGGQTLEANNIGDFLFNKGLITADQLKEIKFEAVNKGMSIEDVVTRGNYLSEDQLFAVKSEIYNVPFVKITDQRIPVEVLNRFTQEVAKKNQAVAFEETPDALKVAMVDPLDLQKIRFLGTSIGKRIEPYYATPSAINQIIDTKYGAQISSEVTEAMEDVGDVVKISGSLSNTEDTLQGDIASAPVARIVNMILEYAAKYKASDVHIEPRETRLVVRYRISGVLSEKLSLPKKLGNAVVSRIKILSNLKIDEHRVPQDGRFQINVDSELIDLRVSVMPSVYGEKVVIRLLAKGGGALSLEDTGLRGKSFQLFSEAIRKTQGIVLVTGPTGSGKTQTLASCLKILNRQEVNIMTLEDPVEIRIDGITQVQVDAEVGLTFAKGLRAFLRQDPDIVMVGEIRDRETAELAVQASLTGHLVLATLHTNSAAGALPRLTDMGVEPFLLASTINIAAAQRLVRKICTHCKIAEPANGPQIERLQGILSTLKGFNLQTFMQKNGGKILLFKGKGCPQCGDTGYVGRIGIFEVFRMSEQISAMTLSHESTQNIEKQAIEEGMVTMMQDGFLKALEGVTTIEEVLRVVG